MGATQAGGAATPPQDSIKPAIYVYDAALPAADPQARSPEATRAQSVDAARDAALATAQGPGQANDQAVTQVARQATASPGGTAALPAPPLRIMLALDESGSAAPLDVVPEYLESLTTYCYLIGGWVTVNRLGLAILESVTLDEIRHRAPLDPDSPYLQAFLRAYGKVEAAVAGVLPRLAVLAAEVMRMRLDRVLDTATRESARYGILRPAAVPPPAASGDGTEGGPGQQAKPAGGGTGGGQGQQDAGTASGEYKAASDTDGDTARDLIAAIQKLSRLAGLASDAEAKLSRAQTSQGDESAQPNDPQGGAGGATGTDSTKADPANADPADADVSKDDGTKAADSARQVEQLTAAAVKSRQDWTAELAAAQGDPGQPAQAASGPGQPEPQRRMTHPFVAGIFALCAVSDPASSRYTDSNVLRQATRYLDTMLNTARLARTGDYFTGTLEADLAAPDGQAAVTGGTVDGGRPRPEHRAADWALRADKPYPVEPFASDAVLTVVYQSLLAGLSDPGSGNEVVNALYYRVLVSYWEALILRREELARQQEARNDWLMKPGAKVASAMSLAGLFGVSFGVLPAVIGFGLMAKAMTDAVADMEAAAARDTIEAVIGGEGGRLAQDIAVRPTAWPLVAELLPRLGAEQALAAVSPVGGMLYFAYQDLATLAGD